MTGSGGRRTAIGPPTPHRFGLAGRCRFPASSAVRPSCRHQNPKEAYFVDSSHGRSGPLEGGVPLVSHPGGRRRHAATARARRPSGGGAARCVWWGTACSGRPVFGAVVRNGVSSDPLPGTGHCHPERRLGTGAVESTADSCSPSHSPRSICSRCGPAAGGARARRQLSPVSVSTSHVSRLPSPPPLGVHSCIPASSVTPLSLGEIP